MNSARCVWSSVAQTSGWIRMPSVTASSTSPPPAGAVGGLGAWLGGRLAAVLGRRLRGRRGGAGRRALLPGLVLQGTNFGSERVDGGVKLLERLADLAGVGPAQRGAVEAEDRGPVLVTSARRAEHAFARARSSAAGRSVLSDDLRVDVGQIRISK